MRPWCSGTRIEGGFSPLFDTSVWANRYVPGTGWTPPVRLAESRRGCQTTALVGDGSGGALAVWGCRTRSAEPEKFESWSSRLTAAGSWEIAERLAFVPEGAEFHLLGGDEAGNALGLWNDAVAGGLHQLKGARFSATRGWGPLEPIGEPADVWPEHVLLSRGGESMAVWTDDGWFRSDCRIHAAQRTGGAWEPAVEVGGPTFSYGIASTPSGEALAVWAGNGIWANRFASPD